MKVSFFPSNLNQKIINQILATHSNWTIDNTNFELLLVLGGDGTFLEALKLFHRYKIKILLINTGKIGFLAKFDYEQFLTNDEKFNWTPFHLLELKTQKSKFYAINDLIVSIINNPVEINITINKCAWYKYRGSGFIINTMYGSTGLNRSINGPLLLDEQIYTFHELYPVKSSHDIYLNQPLVLNKNHYLECSLKTDQELQIKIDGQTKILKATNYKIQLILSKAKIIHIDLATHLFKIKSKLIGLTNENKN